MHDSWFWDTVVRGVVDKEGLHTTSIILVLAIIYSALLTYRALKREGVFYNIFLLNIFARRDESFGDYVKRQLDNRGLSILVYFGFLFGLLFLSGVILETVNFIYKLVRNSKLGDISEAIVGTIVISILAIIFNNILGKQSSQTSKDQP